MSSYLAGARELFPYTQELRRDFHRHPELGFQEFRTSEAIVRELQKLSGMDVRSGVAETGVVGLLETGKPGPVILLRFDMDALPVTENTGVDYCSQHPGLMHACGHDGHMAIGITVARLLHSRRDQLQGKLKFVFQPAEEGLGGAQKMIQAGVLRGPRPDINLALHIWNEKPVGWFGISDGPLMAASDTFTITIQGKGGHGAKPQEAIDPLLAGSQLIVALQSITSREISPLDAGVISVTTFQAGRTHNVIPDRALLSGTIRTFKQATRELLLKRLEEVSHGIAKAMRCRMELEITETSPAVVNDPRIAAEVRKAAGQVFPAGMVENSYQTMVSEDMAWMMDGIPSCYALIGSANPERKLTARHHQPEFNFDEAALIHGTALLAASVDRLQQA